MNTKIVQKCGCYEGDCVEILGLEVPLYACFTCGYAGVTPSGADNPHEDEVHVHDLLAEVKWLRKTIERAVSTLRSPDPDDLEDGPYYHAEMLSFTDQMICYALDILEGKE
jgi:hypothetical protein